MGRRMLSRPRGTLCFTPCTAISVAAGCTTNRQSVMLSTRKDAICWTMRPNPDMGLSNPRRSGPDWIAYFEARIHTGKTSSVLSGVGGIRLWLARGAPDPSEILSRLSGDKSQIQRSTHATTCQGSKHQGGGALRAQKSQSTPNHLPLLGQRGWYTTWLCVDVLR